MKPLPAVRTRHSMRHPIWYLWLLPSAAVGSGSPLPISCRTLRCCCLCVYEDARGITLKADLPGVSHDRLGVQVDGNTLTIDGQAAIDMPEGMEAVYADVKWCPVRAYGALFERRVGGAVAKPIMAFH